jgi:hypothetical protein
VGKPRPDTTLSKDPESECRIARSKSNIHLVCYGAIRLFESIDDETKGKTIKTIEVNPSLLLYGDPDHSLTNRDLLFALGKVQKEIAPLLADSRDVRHIIPGLAGRKASRAHWRNIESDVTLPGVRIEELHNLSHPYTGPAAGTSRERIQLGFQRDDLIITFEALKPTQDGVTGEFIQGVRAKVSLKGRGMVARYRRPDTTALVEDQRRLIRIEPTSFAQIHQEVMSLLEGTYLPILAERPGGHPVTFARIIALASCITPISISELRAMDATIRQPSKDTRKNLNREVRNELARLTPFPVTSLFSPELYASSPTDSPLSTGETIDPQIVGLYGSGHTAS